ncbi:T9SS type A sorting domain-containing protein [Spirosoma aerolatum]|uniref:T9SS type A sorting domain-containing protein n=1 Tax=Spirosoma aerolatum TaxID=1211326 RepID=UPI001472BEAF
MALLILHRLNKTELNFALLDANGHEVLKKSFYQTTEFRTDKSVKSVYFYRIRNEQRIITGKLIID